MADVFSKSKRSEVMSRIRSRGNAGTEMALVRIFRKEGIKGWRRHFKLKISNLKYPIGGKKGGKARKSTPHPSPHPQPLSHRNGRGWRRTLPGRGGESGTRGGTREKRHLIRSRTRDHLLPGRGGEGIPKSGGRGRAGARSIAPRPKLSARAATVRPDFVFQEARVAVFVDGCFWHGCPRCYVRPRGNAAFWRKKLATNRARDRRVNRALRRLGWRVVRIWEHELRNEERIRRILDF
jgi:DNA mismatch endonuclease Vsr